MKRLQKIMLLAALATMLILPSTTLAAGPTAKNPAVWKLNCNYNPSGLIADYNNKFASLVKEKTGGRVIIEVYYNASLGFKRTEGLTVVKNGMVELNEICTGNSYGEEPVSSLVSLPFMFNDTDSYLKWHTTVYLPAITPLYAKKWNCKPVGVVLPFPPIYLYSKEPAVTVEQLKGMKIRTWGGILQEALKRLGASPFVINTAELYTALQRNTVSAAITSHISATEAHFWEVLKYINKIALVITAETLVVNLDAYNALPDDLKKIVDECAVEARKYAFAKNQESLKTLEKKLTGGGMKVLKPSLEEMKKIKGLLSPMYKDFAKKNGGLSAKLLKDLGKL
jgi:TRAP-type C4-dicarboxylate transport system substrate-binding protein